MNRVGYKFGYKLWITSDFFAISNSPKIHSKQYLSRIHLISAGDVEENLVHHPTFSFDTLIRPTDSVTVNEGKNATSFEICN